MSREPGGEPEEFPAEEEVAGDTGESGGATHLSNLLLAAGLVSLFSGVYVGLFRLAKSPLTAVATGVGFLIGFIGLGAALQAALPSDEPHGQSTKTKIVAYIVYLAAVLCAGILGLDYAYQYRIQVLWFLVLGPALLPLAWVAYGVYCQWGGVRMVGWAACLAAFVFYFLPIPMNGGPGYQLLSERCMGCWRHAKASATYMLEGEELELLFCPVHAEVQPEPTADPGIGPAPIAELPDVYQSRTSPVLMHAAGVAGGIVLAAIAFLLGRSVYRRGAWPAAGAVLLALAMLGLTYFWF